MHSGHTKQLSDRQLINHFQGILQSLDVAADDDCGMQVPLQEGLGCVQHLSSCISMNDVRNSRPTYSISRAYLPVRPSESWHGHGS